MKKLILPILAFAALVTMPVQMSAIDASDAVIVGATVLAPVEVPNSLTLDAGSMNFGEFTPDALAEKTVVLATDGDRSASSADLGTDEGNASLCTVTGDSDVDYKVTDPVTTTLTHSAGAGTGTMTVGDFTITASGEITAGTFEETRNRGAVAGGDQFSLGATLTVGAGQAAGVYSGSFTLNIAYD